MALYGGYVTVLTESSEGFDVAHTHFGYQFVAHKNVTLRRVPTKDNTSDVFTKTLGKDDIDRLRPGLTGYGPLPPIPDALPV